MTVPRSLSRAVSRTAAPRLALVALVLSACTPGLSEPPTPPIEPPPAWTAEGVGTDASTPLADEWWHAFDDSVLDAVVTESLANNPGLDVAAANLDAALARARIEGAELYPWLDAGLSANRSKRNFIGFPIPGGEREVLSTTATNLGLSLNVSWEADLWGRLRAARTAATAEVEASAADLAAARLSLAAQTAKAYLAVVEARLQVELARRTLDSRQASERRVMARYERGLSPPLDVRLARTQTAAVAASLAVQERSLDLARRQLETLLGRYPAGVVEAAEALPAVPPSLESGVPAELLQRRPDLRAAERRAFSALASLRSAERSLYPRLSLTGSTGTASGELEDLLDGDFSVWSLAANLLQPLFQGGRLRANVDLAAAGLDASLAGWLQTTLDAFREVEVALASEQTLDDQVRALAEAAEQSRAAERLALDRYGRGLTDYLSVLESQRSSFEAERQYLDARRQRLNARIDLILALGGAPDGYAGTSESPAVTERAAP